MTLEESQQALDIARILLLESMAYDVCHRWFGWLRPPSHSTRQIKRDCDKVYKLYREILKKG